MSPYEVLGVANNATDEEIRKAYRKKVMQFHPDRNPGDDAADAKFKEMQAAYEALTDTDHRPNTRRVYQAPKKDPNNWIKDAPSPTHDLWGNPIGKEAQRPTHTPPRRRIVPKPPEEPLVDVWKGTYSKAAKFSQKYWQQYEKLKKEMAYEEPEKFWAAIDEWARQNNK